MTTAKTPKGRIVTIGKTRDEGVQSATETGQYTETDLTFGGVKVASFGYYSRLTLPAALAKADDFIDSTGLAEGLNASDLTKLIDDLVRSKSVATPQDVAAALAVHPQVITDLDTLARLKKVERFEQLSLSNEEQCGSVRFHSFMADWSCTGQGYGYSNVVLDFRDGFYAKCGSPGKTPCLRISVS